MSDRDVDVLITGHTNNDVLFGRGKRFYNHEGNENLRDLIKTLVVKLIVN